MSQATSMPAEVPINWIRWRNVGSISVDHGGGLVFPPVDSVPGIYRFTIKDGPEISAEYIGQAAVSLVTRFGLYRSRGKKLRSAPRAVHLQSGHGRDDLALAAAGARWVAGVEFSEVAAAAQRRAWDPAVACRYVVAVLPGVPLRSRCADLVYTGKGALIWMPDLAACAAEAARLLRPAGHLFIYEAHPAVPL
jgi:SAM-dependent methyltransferase